jgi:hypothetical protein
MGACKVCGGSVVPTHRGILLGHHNVEYFFCPSCEYRFTEEPYWLDEAYGEGVATTDTGLVKRNIDLARQLATVLPRLFPDGPYVDWGGGSGLFTRLMRDAGFEFFWQDRYGENVLAKGFDWSFRTAVPNATLVTAFEVLEHVPDPLAFFDQAFKESGANSMFFTEELHPGPDIDPEWFYFAPVTGQHISFYSAKTLAVIAERLGLHLRTWGPLHLLTGESITARRFSRAMGRARIVGLTAGIASRMSRTPDSLTVSDQSDLTTEYLRTAASRQ